MVFFLVSGCAFQERLTINVRDLSRVQARAVGEARALHQQSQYAAKYPVLRRVSPNRSGREMEVWFGRTNGPGIKGIRYVFDSSGSYLGSVHVVCDGF